MANVAKGATTRKPSGRLGAVAGWPTRPATIRIAVADRGGALARYTHRVDRSGEATTRDEELESRGGVDPNEVERQATALETTIPADAPHRSPAYGIIIDLPYETTEKSRAEIARRIADDLTARGHATCWAVHSHNAKGEEHPHLHLVTLAKPDGTRPVEGSEAMVKWRHRVAETINATHIEIAGERLPIEASGGKLTEVGIDRPPRPDIPHGLYRARVRRDALIAQGKPVSVTVTRTRPSPSSSTSSGGEPAPSRLV